MACKYKSRVWDNGWCKVACMYCTLTQEMNCKHNKKTNADYIRSMSDKELAEFLIDFADDGNLRIREWLQQPAEEET